MGFMLRSKADCKVQNLDIWPPTKDDAGDRTIYEGKADWKTGILEE
jgi:hypothetical protein